MPLSLNLLLQLRQVPETLQLAQLEGQLTQVFAIKVLLPEQARQVPEMLQLAQFTGQLTQVLEIKVRPPIQARQVPEVLQLAQFAGQLTQVFPISLRDPEQARQLPETSQLAQLEGQLTQVVPISLRVPVQAKQMPVTSQLAQLEGQLTQVLPTNLRLLLQTEHWPAVLQLAQFAGQGTPAWHRLLELTKKPALHVVQEFPLLHTKQSETQATQVLLLVTSLNPWLHPWHSPRALQLTQFWGQVTGCWHLLLLLRRNPLAQVTHELPLRQESQLSTQLRQVPLARRCPTSHC